MELFGYLAIICIGVLLGGMGAGGSMLAIPVLVYLFSMDMVTASAYSLFLVGMTSLAGAVVKKKDHLVDARAGLLFGIPSVITTFIARKWIVGALPDSMFKLGAFTIMKDELLLSLFSGMMITSAMMVLKGKQINEPEKGWAIIYLMPAGTLVGLLAGLMGAGGGFLILPALICFASLPFQTAVGTTLSIIAANCLLGFCGDLLNHSINWSFLLSVTALATLGLFLGGIWSKLTTLSFLSRKSFGWITLSIGVGMLVKEFFL